MKLFLGCLCAVAAVGDAAAGAARQRHSETEKVASNCHKSGRQAAKKRIEKLATAGPAERERREDEQELKEGDRVEDEVELQPEPEPELLANLHI